MKKQMKIIPPIRSHQIESKKKTAHFMIGTRSLARNCPAVRVPLYATSTEEIHFRIVVVNLMNKVCKCNAQLQAIFSPTIGDNRILFKIGTDALVATVPDIFSIRCIWDFM